MSCREQQDFAGWVIDSLKFAASDDCVTGWLALSDMLRLRELVVDATGCLVCSLAGYRAEGELAGRLGLMLRVSGRLGLTCQRCLGRVELNCDIARLLLLVPDGAVWPESELEAEDYDAIPADSEMVVAMLVEEEVLLALPLVPRHECCGLPADTVPVAEEGAVSPFAVLTGLKKH